MASMEVPIPEQLRANLRDKAKTGLAIAYLVIFGSSLKVELIAAAKENDKLRSLLSSLSVLFAEVVANCQPESDG